MFATLCLIVAIADPAGFNGLKGVALDATTPLARGGRGIAGLFTGGGEAIGNYFRAASQNAALKQKLKATEARLIEAEATELENRRLKKLLNLTQQGGGDIGVGAIVGSTFDSSRRLATLALGRNAGVRIGQPCARRRG